jgi:carbohydrate diacid regulator
VRTHNVMRRFSNLSSTVGWQTEGTRQHKSKAQGSHNVSFNIPKVSGSLREHAAALAKDPSKVVSRTYARLSEAEECYVNLPVSVREDILQFLECCARLWFDTLVSGNAPLPDEIELLADAGRRRVHQGIALTTVLHAFRLGSLEAWCALLTVAKKDGESHDQLLFEVSCYLLESFDYMSQTIAQAYLDEQYQRARWRDSLRFELCNLIFRNPEDVESFHKCAESLGIDPTVPRIALAIEIKPIKVRPSRLESEYDRLTLSVSRQFKTTFEDLVRVYHRGRLVVWVPCIRGDSLLASDRRFADCAVALVKANSEILAVGVGLVNQGPSGWALSIDEACKALEFGTPATGERSVHLYSDIVVDESVRRTGNVLRYLSCLLERLAQEPELLSTLRTYFDQLQRRKVTADVLGIHPNTLNHRLERIETLLGARLDEAGWIAKLHVAVRLRQQTLSDPDQE